MNEQTKQDPAVEAEVVETKQLAVVPDSMIGTLVRAELDMQIATAKAHPRSVTSASANILSLATLDEQTAMDNVFALPRGGKPIRGPSVRLAEIIYQCWGNCRVDSRVVMIDRDNKVIVAEGVFHDLQTNAATRSEIRRRISDKYGKLYSEDMIVTTGNAACAIAKRNAVLSGVPKPVWRKAYEASEKVLAGDVKTLASRRDAAIKAFAAFGVKPEQIFTTMEVKGLDDITLEHIATLQAMFTAIKSEQSTVEELFPTTAKPADKWQPPKQQEQNKAVEQTGAKAATTETVDPETGEISAAEDYLPEPRGDQEPARDWCSRVIDTIRKQVDETLIDEILRANAADIKALENEGTGQMKGKLLVQFNNAVRLHRQKLKDDQANK